MLVCYLVLVYRMSPITSRHGDRALLARSAPAQLYVPAYSTLAIYRLSLNMLHPGSIAIIMLANISYPVCNSSISVALLPLILGS
jgi:hypothetical protein